MYVTQEKRKFGVGKGLMLEAIMKASEFDGNEQIYLSVNASNGLALNFINDLASNLMGLINDL